MLFFHEGFISFLDYYTVIFKRLMIHINCVTLYHRGSAVTQLTFIIDPLKHNNLLKALIILIYFKVWTLLTLFVRSLFELFRKLQTTHPLPTIGLKLKIVEFWIDHQLHHPLKKCNLQFSIKRYKFNEIVSKVSVRKYSNPQMEP